MGTKKLSFGEKFSRTLDFLGLSNSYVAKCLKIDPSYVSRLRRDIRTPKNNSPMMKHIASVVGDMICDKGLATEFCREENLTDKMSMNKETFTALYSQWLCCSDESNKILASTEIISAINHYIELFSPEENSVKLPEDISEEWLKPLHKNTYYGSEGLKQAVLRLFRDTLENPGNALCIYSDKSIDWMSRNLEFEKLIQGITMQILRSGLKIKSVHYLSRSINELKDGLILWIPLYFMGEIESHYVEPSEQSVFSHTLMVNEGRSCLHGISVAGEEEKAKFIYGTTKKSANTMGKCMKESYERLNR